MLFGENKVLYKIKKRYAFKKSALNAYPLEPY
jgi:hypothetical protein